MIKEKRLLLGKYDRYIGLKSALKLTPEEIVEEIKISKLKGRGGAGFPTGLKWDFCYKAEGSIKYVVCNADEGEPGTFKDKVLLEKRAELVIEGMVIGGLAIGAEKGYIYLRAEYPHIKTKLHRVIKKLTKDNLLGENILGSGLNFDLEVVMGMGAYVCGEETSLINSIEGKRGEVRVKPPYPPNEGVFNKPTLINNVETFASIPKIMEKGGEWFSKIGTDTSTGTKLFSICGDLEKPGVYELELGFNLKQFLEQIGAKDIKMVQMAGASGVSYSADEIDYPVVYEHMVGCGAIIVFNETRNMVDVCANFLDFFADESCGVCTPCRQGSYQMLEMIERIKENDNNSKQLEDMEEVAETMLLTSRCGFGQTATNAFTSLVKNFRSEFLEYRG